jgi:tetratricopeptide (TPR) repeat protein
LSRKNILKRPMPIPVPGTKKPSKAPQMIPGKDALTETAPRRRLFFRSKSEIREKELDLQGISVAYLKNHFLQEVREAGLDEDSAIYDIEDLRDHDNNGVIRRKGATSICPIDNKIGTSYVHALGMEPYVGKANFMLSYAWRYPIGEIVGALEQKCESDGLDESTTYVWICCLCINQHRVVESKKLGLVVSFETFRDKFKSRVIDIGNVWAMMSPWEDPEYIKRAWCLLELFYASKSKWSHTWLSFLSDNVNVDIIMPPKERNNFIQGLRNNGASNHLNKIFELLANTRVQDAEASNPDDKEKILELIKEGPGYTEFNITVNDLIRNWVIQIASDEVQVAERVKVANKDNKLVAHEYANTLNNFGILLRKVGERDDAFDLFQRALDIFENIYERNHADVAQSINNVAEVLCDMGKIDEALKLHEEALAIRKSWFEGDHYQENQAALAQSFDNVGKGLCQQGRLDEALEMHEQALNIYLKLYRHGMGKPYAMDAARSVGNVAIVKHQQKELDEALKLHQKALSMRKDIYKYGHPDIASSLTHIANVHRDLRHYQEALKGTKESSEILNTVYGTNHTETLQIRQLKRRNKVEFIVIRALMIVTLVLSAATCLVLSIFNFFSLFASCLVDAGTGV